MNRRLRLGGLAAAASLALGLPGTASAGPLVDTSSSTCTADNSPR